MIVESVMSTGVLTAAPDDSVRSVVEKMVSRHCGAIPVVDPEMRLLGIVSIRDIILPLYPATEDYVIDEVHGEYFTRMEENFPEVLGMKAQEIMTKNVLTLSPEQPLLKAASTMGVKNFRRLPVVDADRLVGMISIGDINRALFMEYVNKAVPLQAVGGI